MQVKEIGAIGWEDDGTPQGMIAGTEKENALMRAARLGKVRRAYVVAANQAIGSGFGITQFIIPANKVGYLISVGWGVYTGNAKVWLAEGANFLTGGYIGTSGPKVFERQFSGALKLSPATYILKVSNDAVTDVAAEYVYIEADA